MNEHLSTLPGLSRQYSYCYSYYYSQRYFSTEYQSE